MDQKETFDWMRSEIERLAQALADERAKSERLQKLKDFDGSQACELAVLRVENQRLKAPVSDEEWAKCFAFTHNPINGSLSQRCVSDLIASRARSTGKAEEPA
jgi:hypothetical protein